MSHYLFHPTKPAIPLRNKRGARDAEAVAKSVWADKLADGYRIGLLLGGDLFACHEEVAARALLSLFRDSALTDFIGKTEITLFKNGICKTPSGEIVWGARLDPDLEKDELRAISLDRRADGTQIGFIGRQAWRDARDAAGFPRRSETAQKADAIKAADYRLPQNKPKPKVCEHGPVGEGYRLLKDGETVQKGDEFWSGFPSDVNPWQAASGTIGYVVGTPVLNFNLLDAYRRKIAEPSVEKWIRDAAARGILYLDTPQVLALVSDGGVLWASYNHAEAATGALYYSTHGEKLFAHRKGVEPLLVASSKATVKTILDFLNYSLPAERHRIEKAIKEAYSKVAYEGTAKALGKAVSDRADAFALGLAGAPQLSPNRGYNPDDAVTRYEKAKALGFPAECPAGITAERSDVVKAKSGLEGLDIFDFLLKLAGPAAVHDVYVVTVGPRTKEGIPEDIKRP